MLPFLALYVEILFSNRSWRSGLYKLRCSYYKLQKAFKSKQNSCWVTQHHWSGTECYKMLIYALHFSGTLFKAF